MTIKIAAIGLTMLIVSCNSSKDDNAATIKSLNDQSLQCISIMNDADAKKNAAIAANDAPAITAAQKTMDSAAMENAKIGQQLIQLQEKK